MKNQYELRRILLEFNNEIQKEDLFPAYSQKARKLVVTDPYAFLLALCLDRGTKAEIIWSIPNAIRQELGRLDIGEIFKMSEDEIQELINRLPYKPRYKTDAPKTIKELTTLIVEEFESKPESIWQGRNAKEVKETLLKIYGVGPGISNMALLLIEKAFGPQFDEADHKLMDIKPDVHTKRVLYRMGLANAEKDTEAILAAWLLNPEYPGQLDGPLWIIGKRWCHAINLECQRCIVNKICERGL